MPILHTNWLSPVRSGLIHICYFQIHVIKESVFRNYFMKLYTRKWLMISYICHMAKISLRWRHQMETFSALLAFVRGIQRSPVNSLPKGQWRGALLSSLIYTWINGWVNNGEAGDLRRHRAHYNVTVMTVRLAKFNSCGIKMGKQLDPLLSVLCNYSFMLFIGGINMVE